MPSPRLHVGRWSSVGSIYALTSITDARARLFVQADLAALVEQVLQAMEQEQRVRNLAWVIMPDHMHWLMQLRRGTLDNCMQRVKSRSSLLINRQLKRSGRIWQSGYFDHALRRDDDLRRHATYILANPIRAGMSRALGEYPFAWCRWPMEDLPCSTRASGGGTESS
ncbi:REP-associated tyrosine transposase [Stenotrophomonas sp. GZD-301]|uniref:REP-associated tyrosine transposase n=1 Tax=Stenotrophomonas sp. GZD-301 TaxID=3404814 RepID=UPI003BB56AF6